MFYRLRQLMYGRYGSDALSMALLVLGLFISFILLFFADMQYLRFLSSIPIFIAIFRMYSKNISKRRAENEKFMIIANRVRGKFKTTKYQMDDKKYNKYFTCPSCGVKLRVPKGKGKLNITCPKCKTGFKGKS